MSTIKNPTPREKTSASHQEIRLLSTTSSVSSWGRGEGLHFTYRLCAHIVASVNHHIEMHAPYNPNR